MEDALSVLNYFKASFLDEIKNDFEIRKNEIVVTFADGKKAVVKTKKCSQ